MSRREGKQTAEAGVWQEMVDEHEISKIEKEMMESARVEPRLRLVPEFVKEIVKEGASSKKETVFFYHFHFPIPYRGLETFLLACIHLFNSDFKH